MRKSIGIVAGIGLAVFGAACNKNFLTNHPVAVAGATIADSTGRTVATVSLWQEASGLVHVDVETVCATGGCTLSPGDHGIHFHSVGSCVAASSPVFSSAGGHYNPLGKQHGLSNPAGPHAGDAPNFTVGVDGKGKGSFTTDRITLTAGPTSLFDADGSSIVIHAGADDQTSQPAGNSGGRIACGVVKTVP
jgi:superoxide dismutase, Cu-Zn family